MSARQDKKRSAGVSSIKKTLGRSTCTDDETPQRSPKQITIPHHSLGRPRRIKDPEQLFQVILHETVKEDLVLVPHGG